MSDDMPTSAPSNSHKSRIEAQAPKKDVSRVTSSEAIQRKTPLSRRIAETFTGDDMSSVGGYILFEVLLPSAKTMISDAVSQGIERLLFGTSSRSTRVSGRSTSSYHDYGRMYSTSPNRGRNREEPRTMSRQARANHDFREIILESRGEAEMVIDQLGELIERYEVATVSDLYQMVGITGTFAEEKWGWTDIRSAGVRRVREGYLLDLPRPSALD